VALDPDRFVVACNLFLNSAELVVSSNCLEFYSILPWPRKTYWRSQSAEISAGRMRDAYPLYFWLPDGDILLLPGDFAIGRYLFFYSRNRHEELCRRLETLGWRLKKL